MGGNQTSVTMVGFCGAGAVLLFWVLGFFAPDFMMAAPAGVEAAVTTFLVGVFTYFLPAFGTKEGGPSAKP